MTNQITPIHKDQMTELYSNAPDKKTQALYNKAAKWLMPLISHKDHGIKTDKGVPHCNTKEQLLAAFNTANFRNIQLLRQYHLKEHWADHCNRYFTGNDYNHHSKLTLLYLDVDCKAGVGSAAGSLRFCREVLEKLFPNVYHEPSSSGIGRAAYIIVNKGDESAENVNRLLKILQSYLKSLVGSHDISDVEVKGMLMEMKWGEEKGKVDDITMGQLARLPKQIERFDEWQKMPVVTMDRLRNIAKLEFDNRQKQTIGGKGIFGATTPMGGSCTNVPVTKETLDLIEHYRAVARQVMPERLKASCRYVVETEDMAIFLMLLHTFTDDINDDGTMPSKRFEAVWTALYQSGAVTKAYHKHRFKAIRDYLSQMSLLEWEDETYCFFTSSDRKGRACKWQASAELMNMIDEEILGGKGIFGATTPMGDTIDDFPRPVRVISIDDADLHSDRIDEVVRAWTPQEAIDAA